MSVSELVVALRSSTQGHLFYKWKNWPQSGPTAPSPLILVSEKSQVPEGNKEKGTGTKSRSHFHRAGKDSIACGHYYNSGL